jgi:CO/xanthine dehydrogenase Mo-binding subunit
MTGFLHEKEFSRKRFLKGGGALFVGFSILGSGLAAKASAAAAQPTGYLPDPAQVDSWISVLADNTVVFKTSQIECGNGVTTGLCQLVAEEMNLPAASVSHVAWDSWNMVNSGSTGGSTGIQSSAGPPLRSAAATAMQALLNMASTNLGVSVGGLSVANGVISVGGKTVTYGQLVAGKLQRVVARECESPSPPTAASGRCHAGGTLAIVARVTTQRPSSRSRGASMRESHPLAPRFLSPSTTRTARRTVVLPSREPASDTTAVNAPPAPAR